jgi:hypothetical protein
VEATKLSEPYSHGKGTGKRARVGREEDLGVFGRSRYPDDMAGDFPESDEDDVGRSVFVPPPPPRPPPVHAAPNLLGALRQYQPIQVESDDERPRLEPLV